MATSKTKKNAVRVEPKKLTAEGWKRRNSKSTTNKKEKSSKSVKKTK